MAQPVAYYPDGTPIPAEEWDQAVQSGQARWEGGTELRAVRPDGSRVTIPAERYADAIASGYRIASPEEVARAQAEQAQGGLGGMALTGVEGVARGLTFGLSDQLAVGFGGEEYRQAAQARREVNPGIAATGEIVGAVAPILASGGTGAVARGVAAAGALPRGAAAAGRSAAALAERLTARYAARGAGGRIVQRMAAGAAEAGVEGALYGVGQAITDNALLDAELSAEKILASAGEGALFAGALGGALGGAAGVLGVGLGAARDAALARLGAQTTQDALRGFAERRAFKQVVGNYKRPVAEAAAKGDGALERAGRKLLNEQAPIRKLEEFLPWVAKRTQRSANELKSIAAKLDAAGVRLDGESLLRRADEVIESYRGRGLGDFEAVARKLERKLAPLRKQLDPPEPKPLPKGVHGPLPPRPEPRSFTFSEFWKLRQDLDKTIKWGARSGDIATDGVRELRDAFKAELDDMIERGQGPADLKAAWRKASEDYGDFALLRKHAEEYANARKSNRDISLTDYLAGIGGAATSIATGNIAGIVGAGAMTLGNKLAREQGNAWLAQMADRLSKFEGRFEMAAQALAGVRKARELRHAVAPAAVSVADKFERTREQVKALENPQTAVTVLARASEGFEDRPDIVHALHQRLLGDAQYLRSQMPRTLAREATLTPQAEKPRFSPAAMRSFVKKADALADPVKVFEDLAEGKLDRDGIEALKERRPRIFQALREQVMIYTAQRQEELPYQRRILLGLTFDFVSDESLKPENLAAIQQAHMGRGQPEPGGTPSVKQLRSDIGNTTQLPAERAIMGA